MIPPSREPFPGSASPVTGNVTSMSCANSSRHWKIHRCCASDATSQVRGPMRTAVVAVVALALAACSGDKPADSADAGAPKANPAGAGQAEVNAVLQSTGAPLAKLQFVIDSRPVVGKSFQLTLVASAATA